MNILRNVRWGYTGDGMGCGPIGGCDAVELAVESEKEKLTFVRLDCMDQFAGVTIRDHSTFDRFVFITDADIMDNDYDFDMYCFEEEASRDDPYFSVVNLGLMLLTRVRDAEGYDEDGWAGEYDGARALVKEWLNRDLDQCDIPLFKMGDDE